MPVSREISGLQSEFEGLKAGRPCQSIGTACFGVAGKTSWTISTLKLSSIPSRSTAA